MMYLDSTPFMVGNQAYRAQLCIPDMKRDDKGALIPSSWATVKFYTKKGLVELGSIGFYAMNADFETKNCYPADDEVDYLELVNTGAWWVDDFKKNKKHPLAKKVNLTAVLKSWLDNGNSRFALSKDKPFYLCPAPIGARDEPARLRLIAHYNQHLGATLVDGATWLAEMPALGERRE